MALWISTRIPPTYGYITNTPKPGWQYVSVRGRLMEALGVPVGFDTDVNGAALGEIELGAGKGLDSLVYYTIGTGLGGGFYYRGLLLHGLLHPEMGHMLLRPPSQRSLSARLLPLPRRLSGGHGLRQGHAAALGRARARTAADHIAWEIEAEYLAQMCVNTTVMLSPKRIVLGGGVMHQEHLFPWCASARWRSSTAMWFIPPSSSTSIPTSSPRDWATTAAPIGSLLLAVRALG